MTGADQAAVSVDRVGPGGGIASDSAFGVALVTLWQQCVEAGDPVGLTRPVMRSEVAAVVAGLVDEIKTGRLIAVAANRARRLIGVALLRPGRGTVAHTGQVVVILVDPEHRRNGLGTGLLQQLLRLAAAAGLEGLELAVRAGSAAESFAIGRGFTPWGRRPGWVRDENGEHDETILGVRVLDETTPVVSRTEGQP